MHSFHLKKILLFLIPRLLINIETVTALQNIDDICQVIAPVATGIVFGRVDFTLSAGLPEII